MAQTALLLSVLFPFVGAIICALMPSASVARTWAMLVSILTLAAVVLMAPEVLAGRAVLWGSETFSIANIGFGLKLAAEGVSLWLLLLTSLITPLVILATNARVHDQSNASWYYAWMLVLLGALNGAFAAADGLLFYVFFELTLVPSLLLIAIWGGADRRQAAAKFFIYTFAGSIFLLIALLYVANKAGTFEISSMIQAAQNTLTSRERFWVCLGLLIGFLIKTPVFPLHTWQAQTYAEAPNGATVILAAVMSKLGTYGLLRLTLPMGFVATGYYGPIVNTVIVLCLISIVYGGLVAWVQKDMIRLMAFSSVSHLGLCVLAIVAGTTLSLQGAVIYMIAHGLSTAAILMIIGMISSRTGTRDIYAQSGLFAKMPVLSTLLVLFTMASIGLPLTSGFVGEFLSLQGIANRFGSESMGLAIILLASTSVILGAIYMLHMVAKVGFGPYRVPIEGDAVTPDVRDLSARELGALLPLAVAVIALGVMPTPVLDSFKNDVAALGKWQIQTDSNTDPATSEDAFFGQTN
ncbi:MAG TPA: NADH-quinone oxidoreductase subunit M [Tepidisphaeraceae bacterium]